MVMVMMLVGLPDASPADASTWVFSLPSHAETGETVIAELSDARGEVDRFDMDWGDGQPPPMFGTEMGCTASSPGGVYTPGEKPKVSSSCYHAYAYRSPGRYVVTATTEPSGRVFTQSITITGPQLYSAQATVTFTGLPPVTTTLTSFTASALGPAPVCWMQLGRVRREGGGPSTFPLDPAKGGGSHILFVRFCDGGEVVESLPTSVPFNVSGPDVVNVEVERGADQRNVSWFIENGTGESATASLMDGANVRASVTVLAGGSGLMRGAIPLTGWLRVCVTRPLTAIRRSPG
jgi:hypothetical protein